MSKGQHFHDYSAIISPRRGMCDFAKCDVPFFVLSQGHLNPVMFSMRVFVFQ